MPLKQSLSPGRSLESRLQFRRIERGLYVGGLWWMVLAVFTMASWALSLSWCRGRCWPVSKRVVKIAKMRPWRGRYGWEVLYRMVEYVVESRRTWYFTINIPRSPQAHLNHASAISRQSWHASHISPHPSPYSSARPTPLINTRGMSTLKHRRFFGVISVMKNESGERIDKQQWISVLLWFWGWWYNNVSVLLFWWSSLVVIVESGVENWVSYDLG